MRRRFLGSLLAATVLFLVGCSGDSIETLDITGVMPDLEFNLTDENARAVTAEDYQGQAKLVFFGFTHCPDICPLTLARLGSLVRELSESDQENLDILFVSVDPDRDTPEQLANYTSAFGEVFTGLTGTPDQLRELSRRYRVTYSYDEPDAQGNYDVSHSSAVFGFNAAGKARILIRDSDSDEAVLNDIQLLVP